MDSHRTGDEVSDKVATVSKGLGLFSLGLGIAEIAAPRFLAKAIGIKPDAPTRMTMRVFGVRGIASGLGILAKPKRPLPVWARLAGDAIDLAFLGWALRSKRTHTERIVGAIVAVASVAAVDAFVGAQLQKAAPAAPKTKVVSVTINRSLQEVSQRWREVAGDIEELKHVTFSTAPGGRGTEVRVEMVKPSKVRAAYNRVMHSDEEQLQDGDLRKVKQLIELGEIIHSDASIHRGMHAARPSARKGS